MSTRRQWIIDLVLGVIIGGLVGAIVAVNFIITLGIGYDVTLPQVFRANILVGKSQSLFSSAVPLLAWL